MPAVGSASTPTRGIALRRPGLMGTGFGNEIASELNSRVEGAAGPIGTDGRAVLFARVTVGQNAGGGGQYEGTFRSPSDVRVDVTKNVGATGEIVDEGTAPECFIRNEAERGESTHRLTAGTGSSVPPLFGYFTGWARRGADEPMLPVFTVHHIRTAACTTP